MSDEASQVKVSIRFDRVTGDTTVTTDPAIDAISLLGVLVAAENAVLHGRKESLRTIVPSGGFVLPRPS
jgi:hypothetical protein